VSPKILPPRRGRCRPTLHGNAGIAVKMDCLRPVRPMAIPARMMKADKMSRGSSPTLKTAAESTMPSTGVARTPKAAVVAGTRRFSTVIARKLGAL